MEGGQAEGKTKQITPTILDNVTWESAVMQEEIFGPLLPVLEFESFDAALSTVNQQPKPLAFYLFTRSKEHEAQAIRRTSFGGAGV